MRVTPPPENAPESRRDAIQALYTLVMGVAEAAAAGEMPQSGPDSLVRLQCGTVVDNLIHLMQVSDNTA